MNLSLRRPRLPVLRKRHALAEQCERLSSLIEQASDGIFVADLSGRYTYVNRAGCQLLGYTRQELLGKRITDIIPSEDAAELQRSKAELQKGEIEIAEWRLCRKDGSLVDVEISAKIFPDGRWQALVRDVTRRKQLEAEINQAYEDLNRAQVVTQTGSWRLDVTKNELIWSAENYRIFGIPPGTRLTYETFLACVHPDDRPYVDERWQAALRGEPYVIEHRIVVDSAIRWVEERADLQFDAEGRTTGGIGTTQDITERKTIEQELAKTHENERNLRNELEKVTQASLTISEAVASLSSSEVSAVLQTVVMQAQALTSAQYVALGIGGAEDRPFDSWVYVGMPPEAAKAIGRHPRPVGTFGEVARNGRVVREKDIRRHPAFHGFPAGHPVMTSFLGVPISFRGTPVGNLYLACKQGAEEFTDQDYRVMLMLAARVGVAIETATLYRKESFRRTWLQTVINQMPEGVLLLDEKGQVSAMNQALLQLAYGETGKRDKFGNVVLFEILRTDGVPVPIDDLPAVRALKNGESIQEEEYLLRQKDGRLVPVLVNAAPVRAPEGDIVGASAIIQDITKRKEFERMREEWASIIAHDLRQPATSIAVSVELLPTVHEGTLPEKEQKILTRIRDAAFRLNRMIGDLLHASQIEAKRLPLECRGDDLVAVITDAVEHQRDVSRQNPITLEGPPALPAYFDADRVRQVMGNLLGNAVKYGYPGTKVRVQIIDHEDAAEVTVANQGQGIAPDQVQTLFSRFARTREAQSGGMPGLGLGLYISNGLIEAQGGKMWVVSKPAEETVFHFTVPHAPSRKAGVSHAEELPEVAPPAAPENTISPRRFGAVDPPPSQGGG